MELQEIGGAGVAVTRVGLGGYELGPDDASKRSATAADNVARARRVIDTAREAGINWIDTAESYHTTANETLIGAAIAGGLDDFLVASKVAPDADVGGAASGFRREQVHAACRASLQRLGRDHLDIYFLHWPDTSGIPLDETWGAMAGLADQGLVRAIGLSNYTIADVERANAQRRVDVVQDGLSLIDHLDARSMFQRCAELGIGVVAYEPLASGILSDKTMDQVLAMWTGPWVESGFYRRLLSPTRAPRSFAVAEAMRPLASAAGATVAQLAIAWVLRQPGVTAVLAGSHNGGHVQENSAAAEIDLDPLVDALEALIPLGPTFDNAKGDA